MYDGIGTQQFGTCIQRSIEIRCSLNDAPSPVIMIKTLETTQNKNQDKQKQQTHHSNVFQQWETS